MEQPKKQTITTGNGSTKTPILANENDPMAGALKPSPASTSTAEGSTKPVTLAEALALWQTLCFDLLSMGCKTLIKTRGNNAYMILSLPDGNQLEISDTGHFLLNGSPVVLGGEK